MWNFQYFYSPFSSYEWPVILLNPIFHGLSFGIKFIINSISKYSGTPLKKNFPTVLRKRWFYREYRHMRYGLQLRSITGSDRWNGETVTGERWPLQTGARWIGDRFRLVIGSDQWNGDRLPIGTVSRWLTVTVASLGPPLDVICIYWLLLQKDKDWRIDLCVY
jgi:hypothetical protein